MIAVLARLVLFLVPIVAVGLWVRHRMQRAGSTAEWDAPSDAGGDTPLDAEQRQLIRRALVLLAVFILAGVSLYFADTSRDQAGKVYIPPRSENGAVVPGHFVPADSPEAAASRRRGQLTPDTGSDADASEPRGDTPPARPQG